jgi:RND family efflux transporter MFP subunit
MSISFPSRPIHSARLLPYFAILAFTLAALAACKPKGQPPAPPPPPEVTVASPIAQTVPLTLDFTGTIRGIEAVEVRARVRGFIEKKHVVDGAPVKVGDLLFSIDPRPFQATVKQAEAEVAVRKASQQLAETTLERTREAVNRNAAAKLELDRAVAERDSSAAQVTLAEAVLTQASLDLEFTQVKAPIAGRLSIQTVELGQLVGANDATLLATIINDRQVLATYFIPERQVLELRRANQNRRPGEDGRANVPVALALANEQGYPHEGWYKWGDNTVDTATGTLKIEAVFDNQAGTILPGSFVRIRSIVGEQQALLVPDIAVLRDSTGSYVMLVDSSNKVQRRDVRTGDTLRVTENNITTPMRKILPQLGDDEQPRTNDKGEPLFNVSLDDRIVVNGLQRARPGAEVKPVTQSAATTKPAEKPAEPATPQPAEKKPG